MHITLTVLNKRAEPVACRVCAPGEVGPCVERLLAYGTNPAKLVDGETMALMITKATDDDIAKQAAHLAEQEFEE